MNPLPASFVVLATIVWSVNAHAESVVAEIRIERSGGFHQTQLMGAADAGVKTRSWRDRQDLRGIVFRLPSGLPQASIDGGDMVDAIHLVTSYAAIGDPSSAVFSVRFRGTDRFVSALLISGDPWTDLAVLRVDANDVQRPIAALAMEQCGGRFQIGQQVIGDLGNADKGRKGRVSKIDRSPADTATSQSAELLPLRQLPTSLHDYGTLAQVDFPSSVRHAPLGSLIYAGSRDILDTDNDLDSPRAAGMVLHHRRGGTRANNTCFVVTFDHQMQQTLAQMVTGRAAAFGFIGAELMDAPRSEGALIRFAVPGLPAHDSGLRSDDLVVAIDDVPIQSSRDMFREISRRAPGTKIRLKYHAGVGFGRVTDAVGAETVTIRLGKKRLPLRRPSFAIRPPPQWRGMQVEYTTALPLRPRIGNQRIGENKVNRTAVSILRVEIDSPAWVAGCRAGQEIESVAGLPVDNPERFYEIVNDDDVTASKEGAIVVRVRSDRMVQSLLIPKGDVPGR
ncbi:MAG: PDZ domain-containing protein [Planctomycetota bacterium]